jgi:hypothetical protein
MGKCYSCGKEDSWIKDGMACIHCVEKWMKELPCSWRDGSEL